MLAVNKDLETICAVATPQGFGGISVIRLSGGKSLEIARKLCSFIPEKPESHRLYFGQLMDTTTGSAVDEVLVSYFEHGKSFTGEQVIEISCHGSPYLCSQILNLLIQSGARSAEAGEFTYRAFMNNKLDLTQAEAVLSLIQSQSKSAAQQAYRQLKGDLSSIIEDFEDSLIWCLANIEAGIDFSAEDIEVVDYSVIQEKLSSIALKLNQLIESYKYSRGIKDGFKVVLLGEPNSGKSSLYNQLLGQDKAIVTPIAGTTRDILEGYFHYQGYRFLVNDTAGLRNTDDTVENIGVQRSLEAAVDSDIVIILNDLNQNPSPDFIQQITSVSKQNAIWVGNKSDLNQKHSFWSEFSEKYQTSLLSISAKTGDGLTTLKQTLVDIILKSKSEDVSVVANTRHLENLNLGLQAIEKSLQLIQTKAGQELIAIELMTSLGRFQEILGKRFDDQVMDRVFKEFCIGK